MQTKVTTYPVFVDRPCGLVLVIWPSGATDVVSALKAQDIIARIAVCRRAA